MDAATKNERRLQDLGDVSSKDRVQWYNPLRVIPSKRSGRKYAKFSQLKGVLNLYLNPGPSYENLLEKRIKKGLSEVRKFFFLVTIENIFGNANYELTIFGLLKTYWRLTWQGPLLTTSKSQSELTFITNDADCNNTKRLMSVASD